MLELEADDEEEDRKQSIGRPDTEGKLKAQARWANRECDESRV
ncbi:unannotated protein [freshwater metagenome]|uniref:Unannotated protein n=1 Tax=freshwater metagenome TaxID=449393 RepID=A0A6J7L955_9ZZZZ